MPPVTRTDLEDTVDRIWKDCSNSPPASVVRLVEMARALLRDRDHPTPPA